MNVGYPQHNTAAAVATAGAVLKIEIWKVQVQLVQFENHFNEAREASK